MGNLVVTLFCGWFVFGAIVGSDTHGEVFATNCSENLYDRYLGGRATCPFLQEFDVDPTRIPAELPKVKCKCPDSLCRMRGDFRCLEVKSMFHVVYRRKSGIRSTLTNGTLELSTSCVCATSFAVRAIQKGNYRTANVLVPSGNIEQWIQNRLLGVRASIRELKHQCTSSRAKIHSGESKKRQKNRKKKQMIRRWRKKFLSELVRRLWVPHILITLQPGGRLSSGDNCGLRSAKAKILMAKNIINKGCRRARKKKR